MTKRIEKLVEEGRPPACVIMEPAMMNLGVVLPEPGFLEGVRAITKKHGVVLIFDEVKTGICTARGGAVERWGVVPDMICLGKAVDGTITDYESFIAHQDHELVALAWLYNFTRGIVIAPGREEEWTLSITHTDADIDLYVSAFDTLIKDVTA